jgi:hypothetical protein
MPEAEDLGVSPMFTFSSCNEAKYRSRSSGTHPGLIRDSSAVQVKIEEEQQSRMDNRKELAIYF